MVSGNYLESKSEVVYVCLGPRDPCSPQPCRWPDDAHFSTRKLKRCVGPGYDARTTLSDAVVTSSLAFTPIFADTVGRTLVSVSQYATTHGPTFTD